MHGFGIEDVDVSQLGCDFFIAGTHKWIFGPRGTGVIWGSDKGWARSEPVIPAFSLSFGAWLGMLPMEMVPPGMHFTPGGFHSFEHRWALPKAFELHLALGKANKEVARGLGMSLGTAKKHRENLQRKLDCHSAAELARLAIREGLLST